MTAGPMRTMAVAAILITLTMVALMRLQPTRGQRFDRWPGGSPSPRLELEDTIRGVVVDLSGSPVSRARVVWALRQRDQARIIASTVTDGEGRFRLDGMRALDRQGPAALAALVDGRVVACLARSVMSSNNDIRLVRNDSVTVRVPLVDSAQRPRAGVATRPWVMVPEAGWIPWQPGKPFVTDRDGVLWVPDLPANSFLRVEILSPALAPPPALDRIAIRDLPLRRFGQTVVWRASQISGRVTRSAGAAAAGRMVEAFRMQGPVGANYTQATTDARGRYRLPRLSPGEYVVRVRVPGNDPERLAVFPRMAVPVEEGKEVQLAPFVLKRGGRIVGRVRNGEQGLGLGGMHVIATEINGTGDAGQNMVEALSDREGAFSVCLPAGRYRISGIYYAGDAFLAMRSRTEVSPDQITVTPGSSVNIQILYTQMATPVVRPPGR